MATPRKGATNHNVLQMDGQSEVVNSVTITTLQADNNGDILLATGATVPTDGSSGYTKGGTFIKTGVATGTSAIYTNVGTNTSSVFAAATAAQSANVQRGSVQVALSSAQILALSATPVELVPAQGAGVVTIVQNIEFKMITTATQYANGGALEFRYTNASGAKVTADIAAAVVTAAAATSYTSVAGVTTSLTNVANAAIVVNNATAAFITGTGTAVVTVTYLAITA